jgi:hypothetical protein
MRARLLDESGERTLVGRVGKDHLDLGYSSQPILESVGRAPTES